MSIKSNSANFEKSLEDLIEKYSKKALSSTFDISTDEGVSLSDAKQKVAEKFANEFKGLGKEMGKLITEHVLKTTVQHTLTAPNGPVAGIIKLT